MTAALFEALDEGYDTTVLLDERDCITEGPGFNIFAVINGKVVTPSSGALLGITRKTVLEIALKLGIDSEVRDISKEELETADEAFTATTGGGPVGVTRINKRILGNDVIGPVTSEIIGEYWNWHDNSELISPINYLK